MNAIALDADPAQQVLHEVFGYTAFRGEQAQIVQHVASGGDALVLMPTGGGKSLCYQVPALRCAARAPHPSRRHHRRLRGCRASSSPAR